jgi:predicted alpha/beta-hydrolase family hydrolase
VSAEELRIVVGERSGEVSALLERPDDASHLLVLAHGAGAGMRHVFMEAISSRLAELGIATLRYQFPYVERESRRPDPRPVMLATVRAAVAAAADRAEGVILLAGGKSMGGRMTSLAASQAPLPDVAGLIFLGFPLHPAGRPGTERAGHLEDVEAPMLFLQGTRDRLADLSLLGPICSALGSRATLHRVEDGDHSFSVRKRSGRSGDEALDEIAGIVADWARGLPA